MNYITNLDEVILISLVSEIHNDDLMNFYKAYHELYELLNSKYVLNELCKINCIYDMNVDTFDMYIIESKKSIFHRVNLLLYNDNIDMCKIKEISDRYNFSDITSTNLLKTGFWLSRMDIIEFTIDNVLNNLRTLPTIIYDKLIDIGTRWLNLNIIKYAIDNGLYDIYNICNKMHSMSIDDESNIDKRDITNYIMCKFISRYSPNIKIYGNFDITFPDDNCSIEITLNENGRYNMIDSNTLYIINESTSNNKRVINKNVNYNNHNNNNNKNYNKNQHRYKYPNKSLPKHSKHKLRYR